MDDVMKININFHKSIVIDLGDSLKAAEDGCVLAQYELYIRYSDGTNGIRRDMKAAAFWLTKAAEQNHASAQCSLGWLYFLGDGVPQSNAKAEMWMIKGIENTPEGRMKEIAEWELQRIRNCDRPRLGNFKRLLFRKGWQSRR